jgi:hypothetical protein
MSLSVHIEMTTEAPWANSAVEYYGAFTNTGSEHHEAFEGEHQFFGPDGSEVSRGGMGRCDGLEPGHQFTTDRLNLMPLVAGEYKLVLEAWVNGNVEASDSHTFHVQ